jgi:hypothetical protein
MVAVDVVVAADVAAVAAEAAVAAVAVAAAGAAVVSEAVACRGASAVFADPARRAYFQWRGCVRFLTFTQSGDPPAVRKAPLTSSI